MGIVADVEVDRASGAILVCVYMTHDCGQIINPDGLQKQVEGNILPDTEPHSDRGARVRSLCGDESLGGYPIITFPDVPEVVIELINQPNTPPWGAGEPSAAVVPSAVSNAVFDATGVRLRSIPYTPDKVKAALRGGV